MLRNSPPLPSNLSRQKDTGGTAGVQAYSRDTVCALHGVSPRDRWSCVLPRWQINVNVNSRDTNLTRFGTSAFRKHATFEERTILQLRLWLPAPPFQIY